MKAQALILLSSIGSITTSIKLARKYKLMVIAMDEAARNASEEAGIPFCMASDYLKLSENELRDCADLFSRRWYDIDSVDYSNFDGYSLGELIYIEVSNKAIFELERLVLLVQELNAALHPKLWVLSTDKGKQLRSVIDAVTQRQAKIKIVAPPIIQWLRRYLNFRELKLWLRREGLDYYSRSLVFRLTHIGKVFKRKPIQIIDKPITVFVVDIPNPSVMGTLVPLMRSLPQERQLVIASDPRCQKVLEDHGISALPFQAESLGLSQYHLPVSFKREMRARWNKIELEIKKQDTYLEFRGVDLWLILRPYFRKMFFRRFPMSLQQLHLAINLLRQCHAGALILAADNTYIGQIFALAAKQLGVYSLTIQHGMVNHPKGYLPIRSTQMAVMGDAIREWLIKYGACPEQIVVTGQPRFDELILPPKTARNLLLSEIDLNPSKPVWLIAPDWHLGLWMRELLFRTLESIDDIQAIIRVHPNDNPLDYELALKYYPKLSHRVRISRQHDVVSALKACDVVVLGRSTIGLEALLAGTHIIGVRPADEIGWIVPPYLEDYLDREPYLKVRTIEEFSRAWQKINCLENKDDLKRLRDEIITRYALADDGKNTERVLQLISSYVN